MGNLAPREEEGTSTGDGWAWDSATSMGNNAVLYGSTAATTPKHEGAMGSSSGVTITTSATKKPHLGQPHDHRDLL